MSPDPSGLDYANPSNPQTFNLYSYAVNNPLKYTDPTGMYCYYGSTDADSNDASQYDMHSTQSECTAADENGNRGQWFDDPTTTVNVNANSGDVDTSSTFTGNTGSIPNVSVQRSFSRGFPCNKSASGAIGNLEGNFPAAADWQKGPLAVTFLQAGQLQPGSAIVIDGPVGQGHWYSGMVPEMAKTSAVSVQSVGSNSFTFATIPGMHPFDNGTVSFSAADAGGGKINFSVDVNASFSSGFAQFAFGMGGGAMEASIWHNLISNVQAGCN